ncbi:hypothetical protein H5410_006801 [Solanum commersonii]|uniref:Uncharacterized protein n=1 Tax=Solanum commersonii TaxID=4109 RepID=A0A9J6ACC5_SOLCO|nr:hypothetical protein H5410_006801 [Solanum commersonii]
MVINGLFPQEKRGESGCAADIKVRRDFTYRTEREENSSQRRLGFRRTKKMLEQNHGAKGEITGRNTLEKKEVVDLRSLK